MLLAGCVPLPTPGTLETLRASESTLEPLAEGQRVAVIPNAPTVSKTLQVCVRDAMAEVLGDEAVLAVKPAYEAFYPLVESLKYLSDDDLLATLRTPRIRKSVEEHNVKYILGVAEESQREDGDSTYLLVGFLVTARKYTTLSSQVIDTGLSKRVSAVSVEASAASGGFVTIALIYSVVTIPQEVHTACRELGARLGKGFRSGRIETFQRPDGTEDAVAVEPDRDGP